MTPQTMTEKDMFVNTLEQEHQTTLKVLKAFPEGKDEFRPAEKTRSARELAWVFVQEKKVLESALQGPIDFSIPSTPPPSTPVSEIIKIYEQTHGNLLAKLKAAPEAELQKTVAVPVGPKQMGEARRLQFGWMMLMDSVHHRGQLSIYLRLLGAKVPSIYGPTADEPWM